MPLHAIFSRGWYLHGWQSIHHRLQFVHSVPRMHQWVDAENHPVLLFPFTLSFCLKHRAIKTAVFHLTKTVLGSLFLWI